MKQILVVIFTILLVINELKSVHSSETNDDDIISEKLDTAAKINRSKRQINS